MEGYFLVAGVTLVALAVGTLIKTLGEKKRMESHFRDEIEKLKINKAIPEEKFDTAIDLRKKKSNFNHDWRNGVAGIFIAGIIFIINSIASIIYSKPELLVTSATAALLILIFGFMYLYIFVTWKKF